MSDRITPAYAGKRNSFRPLRCRHRDHPRVCGEKGDAQSRFFQATGSPPRMRGKEGVCVNDQSEHGITPAYAGKSISYLFRGVFLWDHPRVCGEKLRLPSTSL